MAKELTFKGRLVAKNQDTFGYITYVFLNLEPETPDQKYVMCVQFPNWSQATINLYDEGFVRVRYVVAGKDTWFDGVSYTPYKNTDVHFLKFIPVKDDPEVELTI